jgi:3-hydroxyacyl-CoA dehydrogenase
MPASNFISLCKNAPQRVLVAHPFNPPHLMPLVEVVPHPNTDKHAVNTALEFYRSLGKKPILINHEVPGFVANRLQAAVNNEAYSLVSRGIVSAQDLDTAMVTGPGLRWALNGPLVTNTLGGGGGKDGFRQRLERLGPGIRAWEEDIQTHRFKWTENEQILLKDKVEKYLDGIDLTEISSWRDLALLEVLQVHGKSDCHV